MADDNDWKKLPTEEKVEHKNWKCRVEGYEECIKLFRGADDPKNPVYMNYLGLLKKFVVDSNEAAKEKGLEAVLAYVENIPAGAKTVGEVMPGLVAKCLNGRQKSRDKAYEIILMYVEIEKQEAVQEELAKGFDNQQPKIVQACLECMRTAINLFGSKIIPIKPIIKHVPKLLEHKEKTVRDECKLLAVEMYRWAGQAILPQLQSLKPLVMQELEEEFKQIQEKPRQVRFLRSQQDLRAKMEAEAMEGGSAAANGDSAAAGGADNGAAAEQEEMDPYDLLEPMDLMSKIPKDYREKVESKKWQERKEIIDQVLAMVQKNPRLTPSGDYYELVTDLKKMIGKDANVNIVMTAAKCLAAMASALRKDFAKYALSAIEPCMERFKEKKQNVMDALREACDAIYPSTNLEALQEMCAGFLAHKTPVVRQQVALFLARCFCMCTQNTLPKKLLKLYLPPLIKNLSEADPSVRESSAEALGALYKSLGEKIFLANAGEIEAIKLDKIKECADKCVLLNSKGQPRAGVASSSTAAPTITKPTTVVSSATMVKKPAITKPTTDNKTAKAGSSDASKSSQAKKPEAAKKTQSNPNAIPDEPDLSDDVVEEKARELFGSEVVDQLSNSNWKERQSAIESMLNTVKRQVPEDTPVQVIVRTVAVRKPGLKDAHFQCLKQRLELIAHLADISAGYKFTQRSASYCLVEVADKIGDPKLQQQAREVLSRVADHCTLALVCSLCMQPVFVDGKNPKNQEGLLTWLAQSIRDFGISGMDMKSLLTHCKLAVQHSNAAVRAASIPLIVTVNMYSPQFRGHFDQEKPALLKEIDQEIEKVRGEQPPAPIRGRNLLAARSATATGGGGGDGNGEAEPMDEETIAQQQEALITRNNISNLIDDKLLEQLNNKEQWKERQAGLERLEVILRENKFIEPQIGELPVALAKRMLDTNKILATAALSCSEKMAQALGRHGRIFVSALAPSMIQALSDAKATVREASIKSLTAWFDNCGGLVPFVENELLLESLTKAKNPNIQAEMAGWLTQMLTKTKPSKSNGSPELKAIVPIVFAYVEDRNPEVRSKSQDLILPLMMHVGHNEMLRVMQKAKPTSLAVLQPLIEKARAEMLAKQPAPAPKPVEQPSGGARIVKPAAKSLYDEDHDEKPPAPAKPTSKVVKETKPETKSSAASAPSSSSASSSASTAKKKGAEEEDQSPIMQVSNKQKRMDEEKALKTLKWNFEMPRKEFIEQLRTQMEVAGFNTTLVAGMFKDDFKFFMKTLELFIKALDDFPDATISNLDLILRWLTLRFFETNPTVILKAIEYMQALFAMLASRNYHMLEYEAAAFLPYFINKGFGDRQDSIRKGFRQIIKQIMQVYPPVKIFNQLLTVGLASKNARQRTECLEELGQMIESFGLNTFNPSVTLKEIAKQISDRDNSVRSAALNTITIAHQFAGEQVYKFIGKINDKELSMLDERIKRSGKQPINPSSSVVKTSMSGGALSSAQVPQSQNNNNKPIPNGIHASSSACNLQQESSSRLNSQTITRTPKKYGQQSPTQPIISTSAGINPPHINNMSPPSSSTNGNGFHHNQNTPSATRRGEFTLDIDDDDDHYRDHLAAVKLTRHNDIDDLLYKPPELPPKKTQKSFPTNLLKDTQDVKGAIDMVITHIAHHDLKTSIQSLCQVDVVIKDKSKRPLLAPHVDNLINTCSHKIIVAHQIYKTSLDSNVDDILKMYKSLIHCIVDLFDTGLGKTANVKSFKDLFHSLLSVMADPKQLAVPDSSRPNAVVDNEQLIKAINFTILKIIECTNPILCFSALIRLLTECCAADQTQDNVENKLRDLVMKCVWRQIRRLSPEKSATAAAATPFVSPLDDNGEDDQRVLLRQLYAEINQFLTTYPSSWWAGKPSELPLRTVKTLIFHVAKAKRDTILADLDALQIPDNSEMKVYVVKLMRSGFEVKSNPSNNTFNTSTAAVAGANASFGFAPSSNVTSLNGGGGGGNNISQLNVIIRKISNVNEELSREGLNELYEFKKRNPDIEVNRYFRNCSGQLLAYIDENMKRIDEEKNNGYANIGLLQKSPSYGRLSPSRSDHHLVNEIDGARPPHGASSATGRSIKLTDLKRTMADWKSKTQLNDENMADGHLRSGGGTGNGPTNLNRMVSGSNGGLFQASTNGSASGGGGGAAGRVFGGGDANNVEKVDLDKYKNILKKYTRSRTENLGESSSNHSLDINQPLFQPVHRNHQQQQQQQSATDQSQSSQSGSTPERSNGESGTSSSNGNGGTNFAQMSGENLYNEYKRRLELIKKTTVK